MSSQWNYQQEKIMKLLLSLVCLLQGVSSLKVDCPTFAELGSSTRLICFDILSNKSLVSWTRHDNELVSNCNRYGCDGLEGYTVSRDSSHSELKILEVGEKDIGTWTCKSRNGSQCKMEGYKTPSCNITYDADADMLALNDQLVLLVNIDDYYCSRGSSFTLQIGDVTETLLGTDGNRTDKTLVVNLNVTERRFGSVELAFLCHYKHIPLTCTGLREIVDKRQMEEVMADVRIRASISIGATVGAAVAGSVAVTINIVLVVVLVQIKQSKRPETHSGRNVYDSPNDVDGQTDETSGHEYNTLYLTPVEGDNIYNVIST
ncbi:uncharacterized protein LOC124149693 [Haliotis rufescens]|uniref:uncharacterized protein LOC124149693 n=1 Tax=Haliotis rufescens TaxID=6454 RepID=UPI00201EEE5D|nr:uncharacterized protein LOC124149693 [Haliotis rufescens]